MTKVGLAVLALFCMSAAVPSSGDDEEPVAKPDGPHIGYVTPVRPEKETNLMVEVSADYLDFKGKTRLIVASGERVKCATEGDKPSLVKNAAGEEVVFHKTGFTFIALPVLDPDGGDAVSMQVQAELSGPAGGIQAKGSLVQGIATWQWQSTFKMTLGKKMVLVDGPAHLELTVSRAE